ncbi:methionine ABC transporter ATP-binding protein [Salinibacterium sp. PAMC 21357]|uniref:methionine ABC transporter ATP-binding protein n=1 Tax=Salinibacterium sp. PAMC 21357 TaxID=1112215 RepID=UPI000289FCD5|nr:ATP-binding cassette domain-containing protein [Salinibacterium sp. PAMC 21357]
MIRVDKLRKEFGHGFERAVVLDGLDLNVETREISAVVGPSGAGKSTLAQCVTLLERPTSGSVIVNGESLSELSERELRVARRRIGTIFQSDGLFSRRTAAANVALPLEYLGVTAAESRRRVNELLDRVGLADKAKHYPHQLSGGQRQRVGIARALALRPTVLLSDEATSGLDPEATVSIVELLKELRDDLDLSILFITHEMDTVLQIADSVSRLDHGRIVESGKVLDLLADPSSKLGRALQPRRSHQPAPEGATVWAVTYGSDPVPSDWAGLLAERLDTTVSLLGASIETLRGTTTGHATIAVATAHHDLVDAELRILGLDAARANDSSSSGTATTAAGASATPPQIRESVDA